MFHLNGFRLRSPRPVQMDRCWSLHFRPFRPDGGRADGGRQGELRCSGAQLKAVLCQPVVYRGLITQTPMEKLLEGN